MASSSRWSSLRRAAAISLLVIAFLAATAHGTQIDAQKPIVSAKSRRHPGLTVLGYVTPWNSRGKQLVENYRHKFDMICPVWYTVHAVDQDYEVRGAPPSDDDEAWYKRLQRPSTSAGGDELEALQVVPRFILDGWDRDDFRNLIINTTRWQMLSDRIMDVVVNMNYDGVVFESAATHLLPLPLTTLSDALHTDNKILVVVSQPIRSLGDTSDPLTAQQAAMMEQTNRLVLEALPQLSVLADYFSIMTYDMTGPGGREMNRRDLPEGGKMAQAAAQGNMREPGPNTAADWVSENLITFVEGTDPVIAKQQQQFQLNLKDGSPPRKFLLGVPLYGYKYPILYAEKSTGKLVKPTPVQNSSPHHAMMTGAAAPPLRHTLSQDSIAFLRAAGEPVLASDIVEILKEHRPEILKSEPEKEYYYDYEPVKGEGWWRVYLPTGESLGHVLDTINDVVEDDVSYIFGGAGVALWEVGQSSEELLAAL